MRGKTLPSKTAGGQDLTAAGRGKVARAPGRQGAKASARKRQSILLVDDNRDIADVLAQLLRARGHAVEVAYDGATALKIVGAFQPRFAVLDIGLPEMDGYELARRLKKRKDLVHPPVLLAFTGYGQPADLRRAQRVGFADHLVKPIDVERLFAIVERD